jgi:hypothetical protein
MKNIDDEKILIRNEEEEVVDRIEELKQHFSHLEGLVNKIDKWKDEFSISITNDIIKLGYYKKIPNKTMFEFLEKRIDNCNSRTHIAMRVSFFCSGLILGHIVRLIFFS